MTSNTYFPLKLIALSVAVARPDERLATRAEMGALPVYPGVVSRAQSVCFIRTNRVVNMWLDSEDSKVTSLSPGEEKMADKDVITTTKK